MQRQTPVFIVTSSRPRVGKTLIARALTEYFCALRRPVTAFDVNPDEFKLIDYLPAYTAAASLNDIRGEMALFDQLVLPDRAPKVIDLSHTLLEKFFALYQKLDFSREAQRRGVAPMVLFVADPDDRARQGYKMLADRFPDMALVPVLNEAIGADRAATPATFRRPGAAARRSRSRRCRRCCARSSKSASSRSSPMPPRPWTAPPSCTAGSAARSSTFRELEVRLLLGDMPRLPRAPTLPPITRDDSIAGVPARPSGSASCAHAAR